MSLRFIVGFAATAILLIGCSSSPSMPTASNQVTDTFTNVLSNPGPSAVQLTERMGSIPGVPMTGTVTNVSCNAARGGATCPASADVTVANFLNGGIGVNVPPGGTLTFTITMTM